MAEEQGNNGYREKYFDEKFKNIDKKLEALLDTVKQNDHTNHKRIDAIESRVGKVEMIQVQCPVHYMKESLEKHKEENKKEIDELKQTTNDLDYYKRNPKQMKFLVIGALVMYAISLIPTAIIIYQLITKST